MHGEPGASLPVQNCRTSLISICNLKYVLLEKTLKDGSKPFDTVIAILEDLNLTGCMTDALT